MEEIVFQSCFPWKYFVALQGEKIAFFPQKTKWHCLAENAATVRNLHLGTCLFPVVLYFEWMPFFAPYENNISKKKITWKNLILWGFNSGLSSGLLVSDSICFSPVMFMCHPVIKLSFLPHIVKKNGFTCTQGNGFTCRTVVGGALTQRREGDGNTFSASVILAHGEALLLHTCACLCEHLHMYRHLHLDVDTHTHTCTHIFLVDTQLHLNCSGSSTMGPRRERWTLRDGKKVWERPI